jgi:ATP-dependent helicase/nuclease subunit A
MGDLYEPIEGRREQENPLVGELVVVQKPPGTAGLTEDGLIQEARALADRLQKIVTGRAVQVQDAGDGRWRPAAYGDVAVLLRRMSHLHLYEEALQRAGVPYHVVAGHGFYKQQEVLDVLHLLRVLNDPSDDLSLAGVLRSPFFAVSDEGLYHLRQMAPRLHEALAAAAEAEHLDREDRRGLGRAAALLGRWSAAKDRRGLAALVDDVVFESGYAAAAVGRFGGERAYANLRQMVELARRFEQRGLYSLGDYVEYVSEFMARQMRAEQAALSAPGSAAVQLMTIHKAKGLEFPIVAVPDLAYAPHGPAEACYVHPATGVALRMRDEEGDRRTSGALALARLDAAAADAAETGRLLYVALTRARDYLILVSHDGYNRATGSSWLDVLFRGLGADRQAGEQTVRLPTGHAALLDIRPPLAETVSHAVRRVGPRDLFDKGRVAWDRLHERAQRVARRTVADVIAPTGPIPLEPRPPARITATALALYRRCPALYRWQEVLGLDASALPDRDAPERAAAEGGPGGSLSALAWGVMSHRAMELATSASPDAVAAAVEGAVREASVPGGAAREELRRRLAGSVEGFWRSPLGRRVAAARQVRRELPFALGLAETEIHGIIDLLFEGADGRWEVVDYKSSAPPPEKADEAAKAYELQLDLYALAAGRWLGRPVERWSIYFLGSGAAVERASGPADAAQTEADAGQALAGIAAGRFGPAQNGRCGACRFQALCNPGSRCRSRDAP